MAPRRRVAVLISGGGSNLQALMDQQEALGAYGIALVLSNRPDAHGLQRAARAGVAHACIDHRAFGRDRAAFEQALLAPIAAAGIDFVALAGFMRVLTPLFIDAFAGRLINIHPALLPLFPGLHTHQRALDAGVRLHGCTVHHVVAAVDAGPIIGQAAAPVLPGDTEETLAARVLALEHQLYPLCLAQAVRGEAHGAPLAAAAEGSGPGLLCAWAPQD